jgi:hypothetical protein
MADKELRFDVVRFQRVRDICHSAVDSDQEWNVKPVKLRSSKEFLDQLNRTTIAIILRAMDNACLHGRTTIQPADLPTLESMGLDQPEALGVQVKEANLAG